MTYRIKCTVSYDGTLFHGYQRQIGLRTVQEEIERSLNKIHKKPVESHGSGRTDKGVHAIGQVFHFDTMLDITPDGWKKAINSYLPQDIYVKNIEVVDNEFHARYSVKTKEYRYYMSLDEYDPLRNNYVYFHRYSLDIDRMKAGIKKFEGTHDFTSFYAGERDNSVRTIHDAVMNENDKELEFIFRGNGFLRYQIRMMIGTLIEVGKNKRSVESISEILALSERVKVGFTAKPQGLYLYKVEY